MTKPSRAYRIQYFPIAINLAFALKYSIPPYGWIDLMGVFHLSLVVFLFWIICQDKARIRKRERQELKHEYDMINMLWAEGMEDCPASWEIADVSADPQ